VACLTALNRPCDGLGTDSQLLFQLTHAACLVVAIKDDLRPSNVKVALDDDGEKGAEHTDGLDDRLSGS
jgi:hypothetical protein